MSDDPIAQIPGSPAGIVDHAERIAARAGSARTVGESLRRIDTGAWTGSASEAWRRAHDSDVPRWLQAADSLDAAAAALRAHAEVLAWAQGRADEVAHAPDTDEQVVRSMVDDARRQVRESAARTADLLRSEAEAAPQDSLKQSDTNFYGGIWDSVYGAASGVVRVATDPVGAASAAVDAVTHPVQTAKDMVAWDDWASGHGDRALGRVTGSVGLALGSYGVAKGASVLRRRGSVHPGTEEPEPAGAASSTPAADPLQPAIDYATRKSKMDHVFVPKHKLEPLVHRFGDEHAAMVEIVRRLGVGNDLPTSGPFEIVRQIEGQPVHIRGAVVDGTPKIGTVFTP